jgi:hypothetical protein
MLDVDLEGLVWHGEFWTSARPWAIPFHRDAGHAVPLEDLVDRRERHVDLMEALEIEADANGPVPVLPLGASSEDEGDDVRWCGWSAPRFDCSQWGRKRPDSS